MTLEMLIVNQLLDILFATKCLPDTNINEILNDFFLSLKTTVISSGATVFFLAYMSLKSPWNLFQHH
jgi:hypothetical protein